MEERQIEHRKSCLVLSALFPVVNWRSRPVVKSAYWLFQRALQMLPHLNKMTRVQCNGIFHWWRDSSPETSGFSNILALRTQRQILIVIKHIVSYSQIRLKATNQLIMMYSCIVSKATLKSNNMSKVTCCSFIDIKITFGNRLQQCYGGQPLS